VIFFDSRLIDDLLADSAIDEDETFRHRHFAADVIASSSLANSVSEED